jgi:hypothetical protein
MAIHVSIGYMDGMTKPYVEVINKSFVTSEAAVIWWEDVGFNSPSVLEVLNAANHEYVGTEHEIMTPNTRRGETGYTKLWCCIEGQEGKDTFDDRFKDLYIREVIYRGVNQGIQDLQLNGNDTEGRRVWQSVHIMPDCKFKLSDVIGMPPE